MKNRLNLSVAWPPPIYFFVVLVEKDLLSAPIGTNQYPPDELILFVLDVLNIPVRVGEYSVSIDEINSFVFAIYSNGAFSPIEDIVFRV